MRPAHAPLPTTAMSHKTSQENMAVIAFLAGLETQLSILCNSLPMLLPLYSYWRYRRFFAEDEDEYVSRVRGGIEPCKHRKFAFEDVTNGLPLETIYGQDNIHFTAAIGSGEAGPTACCAQPRPTTKSKLKGIRRSISAPRSRTPGLPYPFEDSSDGESTRRLGGSAGGTTGITIETKWTITEETKYEV